MKKLLFHLRLAPHQKGSGTDKDKPPLASDIRDGVLQEREKASGARQSRLHHQLPSAHVSASCSGTPEAANSSNGSSRGLPTPQQQHSHSRLSLEALATPNSHVTVRTCSDAAVHLPHRSSVEVGTGSNASITQQSSTGSHMQAQLSLLQQAIRAHHRANSSSADTPKSCDFRAADGLSEHHGVECTSQYCATSGSVEWDHLLEYGSPLDADYDIPLNADTEEHPDGELSGPLGLQLDLEDQDPALASEAGSAGHDVSARLASLVACTSSAVDLNIDYGAEITLLDSAPIGQGQFGSVFRGVYKDHHVAVKMLPRMFLGDATNADVETFVQEVAVLSAVEHENVVKFFGGCLQPPYVFIVEELMSRNLSQLLHMSSEPLPLWRVLSIALDIANGLHYLHHLSPAIIHRDLKPENILLDESGRGKISDFGLARCKYQSYVKTNRPEAGTLAYMAPECFDSKVGKLTDKADIFSFGVICWEMVVRRPPWQGMKTHEFLQRMVLGGGRLQVPQDDSVCPLALRALIRQCWADDPEERPSCHQLISELTRMLKYTPRD